MGSVWKSRLCLGRAARCCVLAMPPSSLSHSHSWVPYGSSGRSTCTGASLGFFSADLGFVSSTSSCSDSLSTSLTSRCSCSDSESMLGGCLCVRSTVREGRRGPANGASGCVGICAAACSCFPTAKAKMALTQPAPRPARTRPMTRDSSSAPARNKTFAAAASLLLSILNNAKFNTPTLKHFLWRDPSSTDGVRFP